MKRICILKNLIHRVLCILLIVCLVFNATPIQAYADDGVSEQSDDGEGDDAGGDEDQGSEHSDHNSDGDGGGDDSDDDDDDDDDGDGDDNGGGEEGDGNSDGNEENDNNNGDDSVETPSSSDTTQTESSTEGISDTETETSTEMETEIETETETDMLLLLDLPIMEMDLEEYTIYANGDSISNISKGNFSNAKSFTYGSSIDFSLKDCDHGEELQFYYLKDGSGSDTFKNVENVSSWAPGNYYIGYSVKINGTSTSLTDYHSGITITKIKADTPTNLKWENGHTASWSEVKKTEMSYDIVLYRNNSKVKEINIGTAYYNFEHESEFLQPGHYTFSVTAKPKDTAKYDNSDEAKCNQSTSVVKIVTAKGDKGISVITPDTTESSILIAGNDESILNVNATVSNGRSFANWTSSNTQVHIANSEAPETTVTIPITYSGETEVTLTAKTKDTAAPSISSYTGENGTQFGELTATARDNETGIAAYVFSTKTDKASISDAEWIGTTSEAEELKTFSSEVKDHPGLYYFYVKDTEGNIAKSNTAVAVTQLTMKKYYQNSQVIDYNMFLAGGNAFTLPIQSRVGFEFEGWFKEEACTNKITECVANEKTSNITIYAKWTNKKIQLDMGDTKNYTSKYTGKTYTLSGSLPEEYKSVQYQWDYRKSETDTPKTLEHGNQSSYDVKNVADSGEYQLKAKVMLEGEQIEVVSDWYSVKITKVPLAITPENVTVAYGDEPDYTCKYDGFVNGEDEHTDGFTVGTLVSEYEPYDSMAGKSYAISMSSTDKFIAPNYDITVETTGKLTVEPKQVNKSDSKVTATMEETSYTYTGRGIEPKLVIKDEHKPDSQIISNTNYTINYDNNINVGINAKVIITFKGNYAGTITLPFQITKTTIDATDQVVKIQDWYYGDTAIEPTLANDMQLEHVTYYYCLEDHQTEVTTTVPSKAGKYLVYAKIAGNENVAGIDKTATTAFEIKKRSIKITSGSGTWDFDNNAHFNTNYTVEGNFVGTDSFLNVVVNTTILDVGEVTNTITYTVSSSTLENLDNYDITLHPGTLTVNKKELNLPYTYEFTSQNPGVATWLPVAKGDLKTQYAISLYRKSGNKLIASDTTTETNYDFSSYIKADTEANGASGYNFTIQIQPYEGANKDNYKESIISPHSASIYTADITTNPGDLGVATATIDDTNHVVLIAGESADIKATLNGGFSYAAPIWQFDQEVGSELRIANAYNANTSITASSALNHPITVVLQPHSDDEKPQVTQFEAVSSEDLTTVTLHLQAQDSQGLTGWMLVKDNADMPSLTDSHWHQLADNVEELSETEIVTEAGTYYAWVKDTGNNIVKATKAQTLYTISFEGNGAGNATIMQDILKIQNVSLRLPDNIFTNQGKVFQNWKGDNGIFANGGNYVANRGDTLVAQWTEQQVSYRVDYYYMDATGKYPAEGAPSNSRTFASGFGAEVNSSDNTIQYAQTGMELDPDRIAKIQLTDDNQVLPVYYRRSGYTITYSYIDPEGDHKLVEHKDTYLYGATFTEWSKPEIAGYSFVGWVYGESGTIPTTMPNKDITATGTFNANTTSYEIHYYEENLGQPDHYTIVPEMEDEKISIHATPIEASIADAKELEGFTIKGVSVTYGAAGSITPEQDTLQESVEGKVNAAETSKLHINYYFARNEYTITLNVWKANRTDINNKIYTKQWKKVEYGVAITASEYATFDQDNWTKDINMEGYKLADYADWSTGDAPDKMPAGDISVARDYVATTISSYQIEVYYETAQEDEYVLDSTLTYYKNVGITMQVKQDQEEGDIAEKTVYIEDIKKALPGSDNYTFNAEAVGSVLSGEVTETDTSYTPLKLKIYMDRNYATTKISYYYYDDNNAELIGTITKQGKWGTKYQYEPVAFFDQNVDTSKFNKENESYESAGNTIDGVDAEQYDFRNNCYVINYSGHYTLNNKNQYPAERLISVEALSRTYETYYGTTDKNYINVYYAKSDMSKHYYIDMAFTPNKLAKRDESGNKPLTVTIDDTEYYVRIANKIDLFEGTFQKGDAVDKYPGLSESSGEYTYGELRDGVSTIQYGEGIGATTYYTKGDEDGRHYIYIADEKNQFYEGNSVSYKYSNSVSDGENSNPENAGMVGYKCVEDYMQTYKDTHNDATNQDQYDESFDAVYIRDNTFTGKMYQNETYVLGFDYHNAYYLNYILDGNSVYYSKYTSGKQITIGDNVTYKTQEGFEVHWYTDGIYRTEAKDFTIERDTVIYGRYEKQIIPYHEYVYFQLADTLNIGNEKITYITADNMGKVQGNIGYEKITSSESDAIKESDNKLTSYDMAQKSTFINEYGESKEVDIITTNYYWQGIIVMKDVQKQCNTFSEVVMNYSSGEGGYLPEGFHYDDANIKNTVRGYCQLTEYNLSVYYARDQYVFTLYKNISSLATIGETETYRYGQRIDIAKLTKIGYLFSDWTWETQNGEEEKVALDSDTMKQYILATPEAGALSFRMPNYRLYLSAQWKTTNVEKEITHYFQETTKTYSTERMEEIRNTTNTSTGTVIQNGNQEAATFYYADGAQTKLLGISISSGKYTFYYNGATNQGDNLEVDSMNLIAATSSIEAVSETALNVDDYVFSTSGAYNMFSFSFLVLLNEKEVDTIHAGDQFTFDPAGSIDFYYTRSSDYQIREVAKAADGQDTGTTVIGAGSYQYGETVTLKASLAQGYTFIGWFKAKDVVTNYTVGMDLNEAKIKSNLEDVKALTTGLTYTTKVIESSDYIAIVRIVNMAEPVITVGGKQEYHYGYSASNENILTVSASFATGTDTANYIAGYQWYEVTQEMQEEGLQEVATPIEKATAATWAYPIGKTCGTYTYYCEVTVGRKDNGRNMKFDSDKITVKVISSEMTVTSTDYEGTYDGTNHTITIQVMNPVNPSEYEIYYSKTTPLSQDNYMDTSVSSTSIPTFRDVEMQKDGTCKANPVYYYVHNKSGDYMDVAGQGTVTIQPATLTLTSKSGYTKEYDALDYVSGDTFTVGTAKYDLAHGNGKYYTINGLKSGDTNNVVLDFDSQFNGTHVDDTSTLTLTNLKLVRTDGEAYIDNPNYVFREEYQLVLPATITSRSVDIVWSNQLAFDYDGKEHAPSVNLESTDLPDEGIQIAVTGAQTNAGTYMAYANIAGTEYTNDYKIRSGNSVSFTIAKRAITVVPEDLTTTYIGQAITLTEFRITAGSIANDQNYEVKALTTGTNVGTYTIQAGNMRIYQDKIEVTDNYDITYGSAQLVIQQREIKIAGIKVTDKVYDGTTEATVDFSKVQFLYTADETLGGVMTGDNIVLDAGKITATYATATAEEGKTVTLDYQADILTGTALNNYSLNLEQSQKEVTAKIKKKTLTITPEPAETVYGEPVTFAAEITGFIDSEVAQKEELLSGDLTYQIQSSRGEKSEYTTKTNSGTYTIVPVFTGLSATNYDFENEADLATLTVLPRPVKIEGASGAYVTKEYDGLLDAKIAIEQATSSIYTVNAVAGNTKSGIVNGDTVTLKDCEAVFDYKDVSSSSKVTVSNMKLSNTNYQVAEEDSFTISGKVSQKYLSVTPVSFTVPYGTENVVYTATYEGFVEGESENDPVILGGTPTFQCDYNYADAGHRHAGDYVINVHGLNNANYAIEYKQGTLTVGKVVITITAEDEELIYGKSDIRDFTYENAKYTYSGLAYETDATELENFINASISYHYEDSANKTVEINESTPAGEYKIVPNIRAIKDKNHTNYTFEKGIGKLTIIKKEIALSGVEIKGKIYDGTTNVAEEQIITKNVIYEGILSQDVSRQGLTVDAQYTDANVGTDKNVSVSLTLNDYLAARYLLKDTSQTNTTSDITPTELTVTADDKQITYGEELPVFTASYSGFVNGQTEADLPGTLSFYVPYVKDQIVGIYNIMPSGYIDGNYRITYQPGSLQVNQAKLSTVENIHWDTEQPGTIKWDAVNAVGSYGAVSYHATLYLVDVSGKETTVANVDVDATATPSCDFASQIKNKAGAYYVKIYAHSGHNHTENNNVGDSLLSESSECIYACNVVVAYAEDDISQAGSGSILINKQLQNVCIAGQSDIPIEATLKNATGYQVQGFTTNNAFVHLGTIEKTGNSIATTLNVDDTLASADTIYINLALKMTPATLVLDKTCTLQNDNWPTFNYQEKDTPVVTVKVDTESEDTINVSGYTYQYQWGIRRGNLGEFNTIYGEIGPECHFPTGLSAAVDYKMRCTVTATREDNGQSITKWIEQEEMQIKKSTFQTEVHINDWTYGEARAIPYVGINPGNATVTYYYRNKGTEEWSTSVPTNAGIYEIRASIAKSENYDESITDPVEFTIKSVQLDTPDNLIMTDASSVPYGMGRWDPVIEPQENAGAEGSDSNIAVSYIVTIYHASEDLDNDSVDWKVLKQYEGITECQCDFSEMINDAGVYKFTVQAIATNHGGIPENCLNSEESQKHGKLDINAGIVIDTHEKIYDGTPIVLHAETSLEDGNDVVRYQWYKEGVAIAGATQKEYGVTYVDQNGGYTCSVEVGSGEQQKKFYSARRQITIKPRPITITSDSATKEYDRTPLMANGWQVTSELKEVAGDTITLLLQNQIQYYGQKDNEITNVSIRRKISDDETKNVTENYDIRTVAGTLEIARRNLGVLSSYRDAVEVITTIEGTVIPENGEVPYQSAAYEPEVEVNYYVAKAGTDQLQEGTDYEVSYDNNVDAGIATVYIKGKGNYEGTITRQFVITPLPIILISENKTKAYDGTSMQSVYDTTLPVEKRAIQIQGTLAGEDNLTAVIFNRSITNAGNMDNTFTDPVITNHGDDVTHNYAITKREGVLKITRIPDEIKVTAEIAKIYDGQPAAQPTFIRNGSGIIQTQYYKKEGAGFRPINQAPVYAGEYAVKIIAAEGGNYQAAESDYHEFTIDRVTLQIVADDAESAYLNPLAPLLYKSFEGQIITGDNLDMRLYTEATDSSPVGTYPIGINYSANANYSIQTTQGTYSLIEAEMPYQVQGYEGVYDKGQRGITVKVPDTVDVYYATEKLTEENYTTVGKTTNLLYTESGAYPVYYYLHSENYIDVSGMEQVHITQAEPIFTTSDLQVLYDAKEHGITVTSSGESAIEYDQTKWIVPGSHTIIITSPESMNYQAKTESVEFSISKRDITLTANSAEKTYDGTELTNSEYTISGSGLADGQVINQVTIEGSQIEVGSSENTIAEAIILDRAGTRTDEKEETDVVRQKDIPQGNTPQDVTSYYDITYVPGTLQVKLAPVQDSSITQSIQDSKGHSSSSNTSILTGNDTIAQIQEIMEDQYNIPDEPIRDTNEYTLGKGAISIIINSTIGQDLTVYLDSSHEILSQLLTPDELLAVKNGSNAAIKFEVSLMTQDFNTVEDGIVKDSYQQLVMMHPNVMFVAGIKIVAQKQVGMNPWSEVTEVEDGVSISFAHGIVEPDAYYYMMSVNEESIMVAEDMNPEGKVVTFKPHKFSSLMDIVFKTKERYTQQNSNEQGNGVEQNQTEEPTEQESLIQTLVEETTQVSEIPREENPKYSLTEGGVYDTQNRNAIPWQTAAAAVSVVVVVAGGGTIGFLFRKKFHIHVRKKK